MGVSARWLIASYLFICLCYLVQMNVGTSCRWFMSLCCHGDSCNPVLCGCCWTCRPIFSRTKIKVEEFSGTKPSCHPWRFHRWVHVWRMLAVMTGNERRTGKWRERKEGRERDGRKRLSYQDKKGRDWPVYKILMWFCGWKQHGPRDVTCRWRESSVGTTRH